ncbi:MAG: hypothetical protein QOE82_1283 [Thermoanaerobaculia bacterium]|jgi:hypothetical protein|nr:hypothetical protein [Thermoanaerobaculia bacterium]
MARDLKRAAAGFAWAAIRHFVAAVATVCAACLLWTVTYAVLILWAIVTNGGLGGPLAYPAGLFVIVLVAAAAAIALFFPATAAAELIGRRWKVPFLAQIPVTVGVLAVLCLPAAIGVERFWSQAPSPRSVATLAVWLFGLSLLPVGFYWWVAQSGTLLFKAVRALQRGRLLKNRL